MLLSSVNIKVLLCCYIHLQTSKCCNVAIFSRLQSDVMLLSAVGLYIKEMLCCYRDSKVMLLCYLQQTAKCCYVVIFSRQLECCYVAIFIRQQTCIVAIFSIQLDSIRVLLRCYLRQTAKCWYVAIFSIQQIDVKMWLSSVDSRVL